MIDKVVDRAFRESIRCDSLKVPKHYVIAKYGIKHTAVIHLRDYVERYELSPSSDILVATYLAGENDIREFTYGNHVKRHIDLILVLRKGDFEKTIDIFKTLTEDEIVYSLIHLWINLLFLDHGSENEDTETFILNYKNYISKIIGYLMKGPNRIKNNKAYYTIVDVLLIELYKEEDKG